MGVAMGIQPAQRESHRQARELLVSTQVADLAGGRLINKVLPYRCRIDRAVIVARHVGPEGEIPQRRRQQGPNPALDQFRVGKDAR